MNANNLKKIVFNLIDYKDLYWLWNRTKNTSELLVLVWVPDEKKIKVGVRNIVQRNVIWECETPDLVHGQPFLAKTGFRGAFILTARKHTETLNIHKLLQRRSRFKVDTMPKSKEQVAKAKSIEAPMSNAKIVRHALQYKKSEAPNPEDVISVKTTVSVGSIRMTFDPHYGNDVEIHDVQSNQRVIVSKNAIGSLYHNIVN